MHIDFAPPSKGTYNNAGTCRQLANYLEHEDLERMEKGIYTEGFFNLTDDNIYKSEIIKDIDNNIGQLLKTDAKFYAIHVSNAPKELPVIPDFPKDYDWKKHKETTLHVSSYVTVRSLNDGSTYSYYSRLSSVTNLDKEVPDCYFLTPTDLEGYTIQKGDSLRKIAQKYYGNSGDWIYILQRNLDYIPDADRIQPGMFIVIPNAQSFR